MSHGLPSIRRQPAADRLGRWRRDDVSGAGGQIPMSTLPSTRPGRQVGWFAPLRLPHGGDLRRPAGGGQRAGAEQPTRRTFRMASCGSRGARLARDGRRGPEGCRVFHRWYGASRRAAVDTFSKAILFLIFAVLRCCWGRDAWCRRAGGVHQWAQRVTELATQWLVLARLAREFRPQWSGFADPGMGPLNSVYVSFAAVTRLCGSWYGSIEVCAHPFCRSESALRILVWVH